MVIATLRSNKKHIEKTFRFKNLEELLIFILDNRYTLVSYEEYK